MRCTPISSLIKATLPAWWKLSLATGMGPDVEVPNTVSLRVPLTIFMTHKASAWLCIGDSAPAFQTRNS